MQLAGLVDGNSGLPIPYLLDLVIKNQRRWYNADLNLDNMQSIDVGTSSQFQVQYDCLMAQLEQPQDLGGKQMTPLTVFELPLVGEDRPSPIVKRTLQLDSNQVPTLLLDNAQDLFAFATLDLELVT